VVVKVLAFSIDPVMRVWLSGAKTNYRQVGKGDIFNCFGIGTVIQSSIEDYPVGSYVWGNTGTTSYFDMTE
jgi:NADPH-dependent curcumin reductase CurA